MQRHKAGDIEEKGKTQGQWAYSNFLMKIKNVERKGHYKKRQHFNESLIKKKSLTLKQWERKKVEIYWRNKVKI